jgi:hypothetical protein
VWSQLKRSRVTKDYGWAQLCVAENLAIYTISNPQVLRSNCDGNILALINCAYAIDCCHKDHTIDTLADLQAIDGRSNIQIAILTAHDSNILS